MNSSPAASFGRPNALDLRCTERDLVSWYTCENEAPDHQRGRFWSRARRQSCHRRAPAGRRSQFYDADGHGALLFSCSVYGVCPTGAGRRVPHSTGGRLALPAPRRGAFPARPRRRHPSCCGPRWEAFFATCCAAGSASRKSRPRRSPRYGGSNRVGSPSATSTRTNTSTHFPVCWLRCCVRRTSAG